MQKAEQVLKALEGGARDQSLSDVAKNLDYKLDDATIFLTLQHLTESGQILRKRASVEGRDNKVRPINYYTLLSRAKEPSN